MLGKVGYAEQISLFADHFGARKTPLFFVVTEPHQKIKKLQKIFKNKKLKKKNPLNHNMIDINPPTQIFKWQQK